MYTQNTLAYHTEDYQDLLCKMIAAYLIVENDSNQ